MPETSKMRASQILGLNPTIVSTCHAGPVIHQSRCDVSFEKGDGRVEPKETIQYNANSDIYPILSICVSSFVGIC